MDYFLLSLLFAGTGVLAMRYYQLVPAAEALKRRLPNRVGVDGVLFALFLGIAVWAIIVNTTGFLRVAWVTTLLVYLLVVETLFLILTRWIRSNLLGLLVSAVVAAIPFLLHFRTPSFKLIDLILVLATFGATTLLIRLRLLGTGVIIFLAVLLTVTDVLNVRYLIPQLPLGPVTRPLPLLIFPVVTVGRSVLGLGDLMFLVLATVVMLRDFGRRPAIALIVVESIALLVTGLIVSARDILFPFLLVMTPIFLMMYLVIWLGRRV